MNIADGAARQLNAIAGGIYTAAGSGVDADGIFLSQMRLSKTLGEFWKCCDRFFLKNPDHVFDGNAFPKLCAQPNKEKADDF